MPDENTYLREGEKCPDCGRTERGGECPGDGAHIVGRLVYVTPPQEGETNVTATACNLAFHGTLGHVCPAPQANLEWESELERQCAIRRLPFADVKYIVGEIIASDTAKAREESRADTIREVEEIIKEKGHQQEDDTIWCNMDEVLASLQNLLAENKETT